MGAGDCHSAFDPLPKNRASACVSFPGVAGAERSENTLHRTWQPRNGYNESFNGKLRDELLNGYLDVSGTAQAVGVNLSQYGSDLDG